MCQPYIESTTVLSEVLPYSLIIIIIIMNKSQELTVFQGRQKLTSAKN